SWSDLWDEEFEEEEQARQLQARKEMNSRTWSHESTAVDNDDTPRQGLSPATKTATLANDESNIPSIDGVLNHADEDSDVDGLFPYEAPPVKEEPPQPQHQAPRNTAPSSRR